MTTSSSSSSISFLSTHRIIGDIELAGSSLRSGGLVAFPTETVYGLGADAYNEVSVRRIFEVGRLGVDRLGRWTGETR